MSAASTARPLPAPAVSPDPAGAPTPVVRATALRLVSPRRSSAPRAPFIAAVVVLLATGLLGLLALNTVRAESAFRMDELVRDASALADREQTLEREVETLRTPRNLAERARELGMVDGPAPAFLRLPDGVVLGAEIPAEAPEGSVEAGDQAPENVQSDQTDDDAAQTDADQAEADQTDDAEQTAEDTE